MVLFFLLLLCIMYLLLVLCLTFSVPKKLENLICEILQTLKSITGDP